MNSSRSTLDSPAAKAIFMYLHGVSVFEGAIILVLADSFLTHQRRPVIARR